MSKSLRLLLVEDSERDAALLLLHLRRGGYEPTICRVATEPEMQTQLASAEWDLVISDFNLPRFNAHAALGVLRASGRQIPFIVVSGEVAEEIIHGILKAGADQYVLKDQLVRLVPIIELEMQKKS